jgi:hypothetical protein
MQGLAFLKCKIYFYIYLRSYYKCTKALQPNVNLPGNWLGQYMSL